MNTIKLTTYIKEQDVLKQWPMSKATLIRARKKGLKFAVLGAYVCYRPEDIEAWFAPAGMDDFGPRGGRAGKGERPRKEF